MEIEHLILTFYLLGCYTALICGLIEAISEYKDGNDIDDFPAAICVMILFSWYYVYHFFKKL